MNGNTGSGGGRPQKKPNGLRFPKITNKESRDGIFGCPFVKIDPDQFWACAGFRSSRFSDLTQHVDRKHLLGSESSPEYCPKCRVEFPQGSQSHQTHIREDTCERATIQETGVLLPKEQDDVKKALGGISNQSDKWYELWRALFSLAPPPSSPYIDDLATMAELSHRLRAGSGSLFLALNEQIFHPHGEQTTQISQDMPDGIYYDPPAVTMASGLVEQVQPEINSTGLLSHSPTSPGLPITFVNHDPTAAYQMVVYSNREPYLADEDNEGNQYVSFLTPSPVTMRGYFHENLFATVGLPLNFPMDVDHQLQPIDISAMDATPSQSLEPSDSDEDGYEFGDSSHQ